MTLVHQGGAMTEEEASQFEASPHFRLSLQARVWDEQAKVKGKVIPPLEKYKKMMMEVLQKNGE